MYDGLIFIYLEWGRRGHDCVVVWFTTNYGIST